MYSGEEIIVAYHVGSPGGSMTCTYASHTTVYVMRATAKIRGGGAKKIVGGGAEGV